jgi:hypothetical protein
MCPDRPCTHLRVVDILAIVMAIMVYERIKELNISPLNK